MPVCGAESGPSGNPGRRASVPATEAGARFTTPASAPRGSAPRSRRPTAEIRHPAPAIPDETIGAPGT